MTPDQHLANVARRYRTRRSAKSRWERETAEFCAAVRAAQEDGVGLRTIAARLGLSGHQALAELLANHLPKMRDAG